MSECEHHTWLGRESSQRLDFALQPEDAATDMGGQAKAAVAAAEAVLQEASAAVAKQLQRAIPEAQDLFSDEDAGHTAPADAEGCAHPSGSQDSASEVHLD